MSMTPAERAVVEAARKLKEWWAISHLIPAYLGHAARPLYDAIEALDHAPAAGQMVRCERRDRCPIHRDKCDLWKPHLEIVDRPILACYRPEPVPEEPAEHIDDDEFGPVDLTNVEPDKLPIKPRMVPEAEVRRREREARREGFVHGCYYLSSNPEHTKELTGSYDREAALRYPDPAATQEPTEPDPQRGPINVDAATLLHAAAPRLLETCKRCLRDMDSIDIVCAMAGVHPFALMRQDLKEAIAAVERRAGGAGCE
ncbi:MAG: hypothetical protein WC455_16135 [Dehalococcoidia bacterium]|jgi:hypothetical protein